MAERPPRLSIELPREPTAPRAARAAFERLESEFPRERFEDARLLLSELVTNAVKYGGEGSLRIDVRQVDGAIHVEVIDRGAGFAARKAADARDRDDLELVGGWGLPLVEKLADDWGSFEGSTHVWFRIGLDGDAEPA